MAKKVERIPLVIAQMASKVFGRALWNKLFMITRGVTENTVDTALVADADIKALAAPAMYYQRSIFDNLQLVIKYTANEWSYASIMRSKDGEPIVSTTNEYVVNEVEAVDRFKVPDAVDKDGRQVWIEKGDVTIKAYAE